MGCRISFGVIENYRHENSLEERTWQTPSPWKLGSHHYLDRYVLLHWINPWVMRNPHQQVPHLSPQERKNLHGKNWFWKIQFVHFWIWNAFLSNKFLFLFFSLVRYHHQERQLPCCSNQGCHRIHSSKVREIFENSLVLEEKKQQTKREKHLFISVSPIHVLYLRNSNHFE